MTVSDKKLVKTSRPALSSEERQQRQWERSALLTQLVVDITITDGMTFNLNRLIEADKAGEQAAND